MPNKPDYPEIFTTRILVDHEKNGPMDGLVQQMEKFAALKDWYGEEDYSVLAYRLAYDNLPGFQYEHVDRRKGRPSSETVNDIKFIVEMHKRISSGQSQGQAALHVSTQFPHLAKNKRAAEDRYRNIKKDKKRFQRLAQLIARLSTKQVK